MPGHRNWYHLNAGTTDDFNIVFKPYTFYNMSIKQAGEHTARLIKKRYGDIWVAMSGGYDSEFVANCFYDNNISFTPIIWRIRDWVESDYALKWCQSRSITPFIIDKEINEEVVSLLKKISDRMCNDHFLSSVNVYLSKVARKNGGFLVTGTGIATPDPPYPDPIGNKTSFAEHDFFIEIWDENHPGSFMMYTVELFYALLKKTDIRLNTQDIKSELYDLPFRPKIRMSPHFMVEHMDYNHQNKNQEYCAGTFQELIDLLERSLDLGSAE